MAKTVEQEIEQMSEKMTKSTVDGKEVLFDTIMNLGPDGLKKALPTLSTEQQEIVKEAIQEMKKATNLPEVTQDASVLSPVHTETKNAKLKTESLSGSDDEDEKLMQDKNKDIKHQGGPTGKPEGWDGQIIKAKEPPHKGPSGGIIIGHTQSGKPIYEHAGHESHKEFSPHEHHDASQVHLRQADKHWDAAKNSPYASVAGLQSLGGRKKKFKEAAEQHAKDSGEHKLHRESAAYHRRMADAKMPNNDSQNPGSTFSEQAPVGTGSELTPDDHRAQADRHMTRVNHMHEMRKCGHMAKDMGQGGAGDYGLAMSEDVKKAEELFQKKQGVPEGVDPEKWERGVREVKEQGHDKTSAIKIINSTIKKGDEMDNCGPKEKMTPEQKLEKQKMKKAKRIAKSLHKIAKMAKSLGMTKEQVKKAIEDANGDLKMVKSEMKSKCKINKEENQVEIETQDESAVTAPKPDTSKGDLEVKPDATADEAVAKVATVAKSINWGFKNSIGAGTLGRNTHWDVDGFIEKDAADRAEIIKKGGYFGEAEVEALKKSGTEKTDLNDLIEKGMDYSTNQVARIESIRTHNPGKVRKSNYDLEIAASMGISEEDYKKIFGSNEDY